MLKIRTYFVDWLSNNWMTYWTKQNWRNTDLPFHPKETLMLPLKYFASYSSEQTFFIGIVYIYKRLHKPKEITYYLQCWHCSSSLCGQEKESESNIFPFTLTARLNSAMDHRGLASSWIKQGHHEKNMRPRNTDTNVQIFLISPSPSSSKIWQKYDCDFNLGYSRQTWHSPE